MNEVRQLFKNTVALTIADLVGRAGNIFLAFFLARYVQASGFGIYSTAMAYYGLIALAGAMGAENFLVREIAREPSKTSRYVIHFGAIGLAFSAIIMALIAIALPYFHYARDQAASIRLIMFAIVPGILNVIQRALFIAHQRVQFVTYARLISVTLNVLISVYLLLKGYGVVSLIIAFVIQEYVVVVAYSYFISHFITALQWKFDSRFALKLLRDIRTFVALSILGALFSRPEVLLLSLLSNEAQVGFYSAASKLVDLWYFIPQIYMTNVFPILSRAYHSSDPRCKVIQDRSVTYVLFISLPLSAGLFALSQPIIHLVYGPAFSPSVSVLQVLAWTLPVNALNAVLWRVLAARDQQHLDLRARIISLVTRLGGGYLLIGLLTSIGAAISAMASVFLNTCLLAFYVNRRNPKVHVSRVAFRSLLAAGGMAVITGIFRQYLDLWGLILLAIATYSLLVYFLRVLSSDDLAMLRKIWQRDVSETI